MTSTRQRIELQGRESLLIILMGSLGDLVRGFCLPGLIKRRYPAIRITWLVEPRWKALVEHHERIDNVLVFDRPKGLKALPGLQRALRRQAFDITLDLQRHFKSGLFSLLSGSPRRVGFHPRNAKEFNWIFNNTHIPFFAERQSKLRHYLQFAAAMGIETASPLNFGLDALARTTAPECWAPGLKRPYIVVVMGSSWETKNWHADGYQQLLARILARFPLGVVLTGDHSQQPTARRISAACDTHRLVDLTGRTNLPELTALLGQAVAGIGPDSGPGHLAAAVGTPYVTLFGPTSPGRVAPYRCEDLAVVADIACAGCYRKRCPMPVCTCMAAITPAMVIDKLTVALQAPRARPAGPNDPV